MGSLMSSVNICVLTIGLGAAYLVPGHVQAGVTSSASADISTVRIQLQDPVPLEGFLKSHDASTIRGNILQSSVFVGGEELQEFYVVGAGSNNTDIKNDYVRNRSILIENLKKHKPQIAPATAADVSTVTISALTVTGSKDVISGIEKGLKIRSQEIIAPQTMSTSASGKPVIRSAVLQGIGGIIAAVAVTQPLYKSVPTSGISYFYPDSAGGRSVEQHMTWPSTANFLPDQTYEHKVYLYNYDRKTYLDGTSTAYPHCYPNAVYAVTSWPGTSYPYLDTRFSAGFTSCEIDELSYTIGAAQANVLLPNRDYFTYIRLANGNDTTDKFKLQAQVGYRNPSSCYTTWCSAKYKIYNLIPSWSTAVPGTQSWGFAGVTPDAPSNVSVTAPWTGGLQVFFTDNTYDETNILIERKLGTNGSWVSLGGFGVLPDAGLWNWTDISVAHNTTYCYRLRAINDIGSSAYSNEACGTAY